VKSCFPEVLEEVVRRSAAQCFKDSGVAFAPVAAPAALRLGDAHVAGLMGFTGQIDGQLMVVSTFEVIATMRLSGVDPTALSKSRAGDWILIRDCVGEFANQFVGRMKNRLRGFDIRFNVGTPTALSGPALLASASRYKDGRTFAFGRGKDLVHVVIKVAKEPSLVSPESKVVGPDLPREGDLLLL
jgi:hypothetical protein